ncbi:hypothetical protein HYW58_00925 [Candidatus Kaiserbacteria bacterium]|nr:hypothetical protein [Candidatus Kaiserbacteria bacterium]
MRRFGFACISFFIIFLWTNAATFSEDKRPSLGDYGYRHKELHERGVVKKLMEKFGTTCCDGGKGGECRVTRIVRTGAGSLALLNGKWCPITLGIRYDIELPKDAFAVVCASKYNGNSDDYGCPDVYCAAMTPGT